MRYFSVFFSFFILCVSIVIFPITLQSASFSTVSVRFDRTAPNTSTTGVVCAKPSSNAVENSVQVTFPPSFTVSTNTALWTVSVTNLPSGTSPWTGIGTATGVSGHTVTFPSGDLNVGTFYCFNFTNANALSTGSAGDAIGSVATYTSTPTIIDLSKYALTIRNSDQVTLSASVQPLPSDIRLTQTTTPTDGTTLTSSDEVTVTLAYGSNILALEPFTLVAQWDQGLVDGSSSNYIDVFDYVPGSATHADDGTVPVIDLQNRKITWNIPALVQSASDHVVTYKLKIKSDITTTTRMSTAVRSRGQLGSTYSSEKVTSFYVLIPPATPTQTPTPTAGSSAGPTATSSPASPTSTPTPEITPLSFVKIELRDVADTTAQMYLQTSQNAFYTLVYGTDVNSLNSKVTSLTSRSQQLINLTGLNPDTQYFLRLIVTSSDGKKVTSDIYTFRTASQQNQFTISKANITVLWNGMVLNNSESTRLLIPRNKTLTFIIRIDNPDSIADLRASFQNSSVLGATSLNSSPPTGEVELAQINPGYYSGALESPSMNGSYNLLLKLQDIYGNFATQKIPFGFLITDPITVIDSITHSPIENAHFSISKLTTQSNTYFDLAQDFPLANATSTHGEVDLVLPAGSYRLNINSLQYQASQTDFEINNSSSSYPQISLKQLGAFTSHFNYFTQIIDKGLTYVHDALVTLTSSTELRDFTTLVLTGFAGLSVLFSIVLKRSSIVLNWVEKSVTALWDFFVVASILTALVFIFFRGVVPSWIFIVLSFIAFHFRFWNKRRQKKQDKSFRKE